MRTPALVLVAFLSLASPALAVPPVPSSTVTPDPPVACAPATFQDTSIDLDPGDTIVRVDWDFDGNGTVDVTQDPATEPTVTHTYAEGGPVEVKRFVSDSSGESMPDLIPLVVEDNECPVGTFWFSPEDPLVGETVLFASFAVDVDGPDPTYAWDVDGDGFDDGTEATLSHVFTTESTGTVRLKLTDEDNASTIIAKGVTVGPAPSPPPPSPTTPTTPTTPTPTPTPTSPPAEPSLMSPFPIVRISGTVLRRGARVRTLEVRTSIGSRITVRCVGRSCPFARASRVAKQRLVRFRGMRGFLRAGVAVSISVRKTGQIGKYTRFVIRANRVPKRTDLCLMPGRSSPSECPES